MRWEKIVRKAIKYTKYNTKKKNRNVPNVILALYRVQKF